MVAALPNMTYVGFMSGSYFWTTPSLQIKQMIKYQGSTSCNCVNTGPSMVKCDKEAKNMIEIISHHDRRSNLTSTGNVIREKNDVLHEKESGWFLDDAMISKKKLNVLSESAVKHGSSSIKRQELNFIEVHQHEKLNSH